MSKHPVHAYGGAQAEAERERILVEQLPQVRYLARRIHERLPRHVPLEDQLAFPAAQARTDDAAQRAMGVEMAERRQA